MAQNTTNRHKHNLASLDPKPSMDPIEKKKYPIYHPSTSTHPNPTIQYISNNFSKLYTNHKKLSSLKPTEKIIQPNPLQQSPNNTNLVTTNVPMLSKLDSSCATLTKSKSQHGRIHSLGTKTNVVKEKILVKVPKFEEVKNPKGEYYETTQKEWKTKELIEEMGMNQNVKKAQSLKSSSYNEGICDVKKAQSLMGSSYNEEFCDVKKAQSLMGSSYNEESCDVKKEKYLISRTRSYNEGCCDVKKEQYLKSSSYIEGSCDVKKPQYLMGRSYNEEFCDVKKAQSLRSRSLNEGSCDVKKAQILMGRSCNEGCDDVKKAKSLVGRSYIEGFCDVKKPSFLLGSNGGGGRRKSFCSSNVELADFFSCSGVKVVAVDMPPFMQIHAVDCARKAHDSLEKFTARSLASTLKREFDGVYGPAWHCIVGTSFGSFVTHSVGGFMYFSMDQKLYILLFKTTVQKAE
ncbi:hypothetical protein Leryth_022459 [Lithospermum erythrorhizon]|nr:hypothetical protein Leryth_022459 [Lithospermum erythrorhizon]